MFADVSTSVYVYYTYVCVYRKMYVWKVCGSHSLSLSIYIYIYIYIEREREGPTDL